MTTTAPLDFVDSDGHVLEHPDGMLEYAPKDLADRIWHIETDADGTEWCIYDRQRLPANGLALAGTAGMTIVAQQDVGRAAAEICRVGTKPGIVGVMLRPNPSEDWKPMNNEVYDPLWHAASDAGLAVGFHPFLTADLPGACLGLRINRLGVGNLPASDDTINIDNVYFTQAISNPFDMMNTVAFLLAGGVCERFPDLRIVFLEANGGWIVPWLERLDPHREIFTWDVPWLRHDPSEYFRRQCWISFDPDESALGFTA